MFLVLINSLFDPSDFKWELLVYFQVVCFWAITVVNFFALRHIQRYTKLLELEGIKANERFVILYIAFFFLLAVFQTLYVSLN